MVTAEGVFPKIGNDPLYASEITRFAGLNFVIAGSKTITVGSSSEIQDLGSIVIPAGSLTNPCFITGFLTGSLSTSTPISQETAYRIMISGTSAYSVVSTGSKESDMVILTYKGIIGSPLIGGHVLDAFNTVSAAANATRTGAGNILHLYPGSSVVIKMQMLCPVSGANFGGYSFIFAGDKFI